MRSSGIASMLGVLAVSLLVATGCCTQGPRPQDLVTPLGKLTPAVQALVRYPEGAAVPDGATALLTVFREKPELQKAFIGTPVQVWHDGRNVVVVVCSPDWKEIWLEDASWTAPVDELWYERKEPQPLGFTLHPPVPKTP